MGTRTKVLLGIFGAAAAGIVIGMLCSPAKGSDLRKKVKGKANNLLTQFSDLLLNNKEKVEELKDPVGKNKQGL